jgi:hypothetical protein
MLLDKRNKKVYALSVGISSFPNIQVILLGEGGCPSREEF